MTYAEQLNILNASVKLKREKADKALEKIQKGFKSEKPILKYIKLEGEAQSEQQYYFDFFSYCVRNIEDIDIQSEFVTI